MRVIASQSVGAYFAAMPALIFRVLTLVALALMPLGIGAAMAGPAHHAPAGASAGHCDDHGGQPAGKSTKTSVDCIACSMTITAPARVQEPAAAVRLPAARPLEVRGIGLHPETATPPPKLS
ncbi:MAG: hypothetical protein ABIP55_00415 [Tepidisphaeraceae bacterium]